MFTGIIEELGRVRDLEKHGEDARIVIEARTVTEGSRDGDSIAVNGVCLTALGVTQDSFAADVSKETLLRSTLGRLQAGAPVNLERAATPVTRLGGHIVQGHVDARGQFLGVEDAGLTDNYFEIAVIPKTWEVTNLSHLKPADEVNLEVDVIAKYVERMLGLGGPRSEAAGS